MTEYSLRAANLLHHQLKIGLKRYISPHEIDMQTEFSQIDAQQSNYTYALEYK